MSTRPRTTTARVVPKGPLVPAVAVRVFAVGLVTAAVAMPWLVQWSGQLELGAGVVPVEESTSVQLRPALVRIPAGRFMMGSKADEPGRDDDEGPRHRAAVAALEVCRTEVTQAQWKAVMGTEPFDCEYGCDDDLPAQNITWNEAVEYLDTLTRQENELRADRSPMTPCYERVDDSWEWSDPKCTGFRLPTETEWEYLARAGTETAYSFGDDAGELCKYGNGADQSAKHKHPQWTVMECDDGAADLAKVGSYEANDWGLFDVHGNVWEWTWDRYAEKYSNRETEEGYAGPPTGVYRVLRGGSFGFNPEDLRSAYRNWNQPVFRNPFVGLRCVRVVPPEPSTP